MRFAVALSLLAATFASAVFADEPSGPGTSASLSEATQFWLTWDAQNSRAPFAEASREALESTLMFDPEKSRISKISGNGRFVGCLNLPDHKQWKAYHVTAQGIAELSFPVRLQWVHSSQGLHEIIRIQSIDVIERNPNDFVHFAMDVSPQSARPGGYRSVPTTEAFRFPEADPERNENEERKSMLLGVDTNALEYRTALTVGRTKLRVVQKDLDALANHRIHGSGGGRRILKPTTTTAAP